MNAAGLRVVAVGAHPDDVELGCGGTVALLAREGAAVTVVDLTRGEMSSAGTAATRAAEAVEAAAILGVTRETLDLGDARLEANLPNRHAVARVLRRLRPDLILAPWEEDPHPDHAAAGGLVRAASFDARLSALDLGAPPFAPRLVLSFPGHVWVEPDVAVDITPVFEVKMAAVRAYRSQFPEGGRREGLRGVGTDDYLWTVEARARHAGSLVRGRYAEGFLHPGPVAVPHPGVLLEWLGR